MRGSAPPLCFFKSGGTGAPFAPLTSPPTCIYPLSMSKVSLWLLGLQAYPKKYIYIIYSVVHIAAMKLVLMGHDTCAACDTSCVASPVWSDTAIYGCQLRQCTLPFHAYCCYVRPYLLNMLLLGSDCFPSWKKSGRDNTLYACTLSLLVGLQRDSLSCKAFWYWQTLLSEMVATKAIWLSWWMVTLVQNLEFLSPRWAWSMK